MMLHSLINKDRLFVSLFPSHPLSATGSETFRSSIISELCLGVLTESAKKTNKGGGGGGVFLRLK